jgi:hypothetical protein
MAFLHSFAVGDFLDSLVSLFTAFILGAHRTLTRQPCENASPRVSTPMGNI